MLLSQLGVVAPDEKGVASRCELSRSHWHLMDRDAGARLRVIGLGGAECVLLDGAVNMARRTCLAGMEQEGWNRSHRR